MKTIYTTCGYCAVGCNLEVTIDDNNAVKIKGRSGYPVNDGVLCPKGMNLEKPALSADRATSAFLRDRVTQQVQSVSVDTGISEFVRRIKDTQEKYGKNACAFYSTGQLTMEDFALLGLVGRVGMGMEGDGNTRLCMASAVVAYKKCFGYDSPPFSYEDLDESDCIIFIGANPVIAQPVLWNRYKKNRDRDHDLIVIDPRKTETAEFATLHVPVKPRGDLALLYTIAHVLIERNWIDSVYIEKYVDNFDAFSKHVQKFQLSHSQESCGVASDIIETIAQKIHQRQKVSFWWTMGINQGHEATMTSAAIIALSLITGNIGRVGTGPNSITGQCNAMGSRINSCTSSLYGGRDFTKEHDRIDVAAILGIDVERIPTAPTLPIHKIIEKIHTGEIKFLWIIATNPIHSLMSINSFKEAMKKLDTVVVQDLYFNTVTADYADIFLPGAPTIEKDGTFINMERRISIVNKVLETPQGALSDYEIFTRIAHEYGCEDLLKGWKDPIEAFETLQKLSKGQPCDFSGIPNRQFIEEHNGIQWPFPENANLMVNKRLFTDNIYYTPNGKAQLLFEDIQALPQWMDDDKYPFIVLTGRGTVVQFHTNTRTGKVEKLKKMYASDIYVEMNADDMQALQCVEHDMVQITSSEGSIQAQIKHNDGLQNKQVFIPMHYVESNYYIETLVDKYSGQPSFKYTRVKIEKVT